MEVEGDADLTVKSPPAFDVVGENRLFDALDDGDVLERPKNGERLLDVDERAVEVELDAKVERRSVLHGLSALDYVIKCSGFTLESAISPICSRLDLRGRILR